MHEGIPGTQPNGYHGVAEPDKMLSKALPPRNPIANHR